MKITKALTKGTAVLKRSDLQTVVMKNEELQTQDYKQK